MIQDEKISIQYLDMADYLTQRIPFKHSHALYPRSVLDLAQILELWDSWSIPYFGSNNTPDAAHVKSMMYMPRMPQRPADVYTVSYDHPGKIIVAC
jgi:hypothetical protein